MKNNLFYYLNQRNPPYDLRDNFIILTDYKSEGRPLPCEESPFGSPFQLVFFKQSSTICFNDVLVPVEALLAVAVICAIAIVIAIHINETVAL